MGQLSAEQHRRRQKNLLDASVSIRKCFSRNTIQNYLPGQVIYNLGEYPKRFSIAPTEYDYKLLSEFAERGVQIIQLHDEYTDTLRVLGADKLTCHDPSGLKEFINLAHSFGLKIILYFSSGFFDRRDPDFCGEWAHPTKSLDEIYFDYAQCLPSSPGWRAYLLPKLERLMDDYGADGLYNDIGYAELWDQKDMDPGNISPEPETPEHDAALEDLLGIIMNLIHRRNGIFKIHYDGNKTPKTFSKVYDYLWVGESVKDLGLLRDTTKTYSPYVVPCPDLSRADFKDEHDLYLNFIPYMQFPLRPDGRPFTGERGMVHGIKYKEPWESDFWSMHFHRINEYYTRHPEGPYIYSSWDCCYGRPEARKIWFYYLGLYKPMVSENSRCWIDIKESSLFNDNLPEDIVVSLFVNEETYMVIANYGASPVVLNTSWEWKDRESGAMGSEWTIPSYRLKFFERVIS